ncbi:MAG: helix-turn-helix transcriptional regulator [bacterium]
MEDIAKLVGKRIREIRNNLGLTQEQVAEKAEMDFTSIGAAERGIRNLSLKSLHRVAQALEVPIEELVCLPKKEEKDLTIAALTLLIKDLDKAKLKFIVISYIGRKRRL